MKTLLRWGGSLLFGALVALSFAFSGMPPFRWFWLFLYEYPVVAITIPIILFLGLWWLAGEKKGVPALLTVVALLIFAFFAFFSVPLKMVALYNATEYEVVEEPIPVVSMRNASYSEASNNFTSNNPDARFSPGDLDFVKGEWIADLSPSAGMNPLTQQTKGFLVYTPRAQRPVESIFQQMPYAEGGWIGNSDLSYVHQRQLFSEYTDIIYVDDGNDGIMGVIPLVKRSGLFRTPYLDQIMIVYGKGQGQPEYLTIRQAKEDSRLEGIQLMPEALAKDRCLAYGWRHGFWGPLVNKTGRISVQGSQINDENSAPYHLETELGMTWMTPFSPRNKLSMIGMCSESSENPGVVQIWELGEQGAIKGIDDLGYENKGISRPQNINWVRVSTGGEGAKIRSGDTDIIEIIPCPRREEDDSVTFNLCGYVATDPPTSTKFFTAFEPGRGLFFEDQQSINTINSWLNGAVDFRVLYDRAGVEVSEEFEAQCGNPADLSDDEILSCIQAFAEELKSR